MMKGPKTVITRDLVDDVHKDHDSPRIALPHHSECTSQLTFHSLLPSKLFNVFRCILDCYVRRKGKNGEKLVRAFDR
jgi:hypothetical protein